MDPKVLVIDNGSGLSKVGVAGEHLPRSVFPSLIGQVKYQNSLVFSHASYLIGEEALAKKGICSLKYPIEHGIITNWEDMEQLWTHTYVNELRVPSEDHPVLLTEPSLNPKHNKEKMVSMMFEQFNVPSIYIGVQAVLSLYSSALTTGLVLDIGDGVSHIVPTFEGFTLSHGIERLNLAGRDISKRLTDLLFQNGQRLVSSADFEICRDIKEKECYVALDYQKELNKSEHEILTSYELPDGKVIQLDSCKFLAPEILFQPNLIGIDREGICESVFSAINKCDIDVRKELLNKIVLSGGTTLIRGFDERIRIGIQEKIPGNVKAKVFAPKERRFSVWIGGSVLACLDAFNELLLTRDDYYEYGQEIVHSKF